jgi:hypothetical protein
MLRPIPQAIQITVFIARRSGSHRPILAREG